MKQDLYLFNNCEGRNHVGLFGDGAFYDLFTVGVQRTQARGLRVGQECVVARKTSTGKIRFDWYSFAREALLLDDSRRECRVLFGPHLALEILEKEEAAQKPCYSGLFNELGHFKQWSTIVSSVSSDDCPTEVRRSPPPAPEAIDLQAPDRVETTTYRILRDTAKALQVKDLHHYECQICGHTIALPNGKRYAEAHHIRPLGAPHNGPDVVGNILCVCPNHHTELDYGASPIAFPTARCVEGHVVDPQYVAYHNQVICNSKDE